MRGVASVSERGSKGGLVRLGGRGGIGTVVERGIIQRDGLLTREREREREGGRERENTPVPRNPREILIVSSLG